MSNSNPSNTFRNLGIRMRLPEDVLQEAKELLDDGISENYTAKYLGISATALRWHFKKGEKERYTKQTAKWKNKPGVRQVQLRKMREYQRKITKINQKARTL